MNPTLSRLAAACCAAGLGAAWAESPAASQPPAFAEIVARRLQAESHETCVMAAVVGETQRVVHACTREGLPERDRSAIFELGSLSKVLTGALLAEMVRAGEVSLDDPAAKYSPPGAKLPARDGREITLRHLVTHTASLPDLPAGIEPAAFLKQLRERDGAALYDALAAVELERPIGGDVVYSNLGFLWLSDILARRGGKRFDVLLAERVLQPLGMRDTVVELDAARAARRVAGHDRRYRPVEPLAFPPSLSGAIGWHASMDDLVRYAAALAGRTSGPLAETLARTVTPLVNMNVNTSIGYAWFLSQRPYGRVAFQNGEAPGAYAAIAVNVAARTAAVVVADAPGYFDDLALHLVDPRTPLKAPRADASGKPPESRRVQ